ncbi:MAG: tetratricopeptide repeat protein [Thermodesulfobacteriota bacterium]
MRHVAAALALVALIASAYGGALGHEFVFDDQALVVENPVVRLPLSQAYELLVGSESGIVYRPLRMLSYMVDYQLAGGLDAAAFHLSSLVYHAAATLALYALAWLTIGSALGASSAAAIFAVHPLSSEAVVYVAGRRDELVTLFVLLALLCWCALLRQPPPARFASHARRGRLGVRGGLALAGMIAFSVLAVMAKESAIVMPVLAALLWGALRDGVPRRAGGAGWAIVACAAALLVVGVWVYAAPLAAQLGEVVGGSLAPQPALSLRVLGRYLSLALWPGRLSADYRPYAFDLPESSLDLPAALAGLALLLVVVAGTVLLLRREVAGAGLLWFVVALLPVAQIVPYREVVAEHNAYLALAGIALAAGQGLAVLFGARPRLAVAVAAAVVLALGLRSHARAADWRDDVTLWSVTVESTPGSVRGHYNLGVALLADGKLLEARAALERAVELAPRDPEALLTLATLAGRLGEFDRAHDLAARAVRERRDAGSLTVLGWAQLSRGDAPRAIDSFEAAIALGADSDEVRVGLRRAREEGGRF